MVTSKFQVLHFITFICPMSRIQSFFQYIYIYILWVPTKCPFRLSLLFISVLSFTILSSSFFSKRMNSNWIVHAHGFFVQETKCTFQALFTHCIWDPQPFYLENNIKNGSHGTFHTFKNYFPTIFSVFSFQQIKMYPNKP